MKTWEINYTCFYVWTPVESFEGFTIPDYITQVYCVAMGLKSLKGLEHLANLDDVWLASNLLTSLEYLPTSVTHIRCAYNHLTSAKVFERFTRLQYLDCNHNKIESLEGLPRSLWTLKFSGNFATSFDGLPQNVKNFECAGVPAFENKYRKDFERGVTRQEIVAKIHNENFYRSWLKGMHMVRRIAFGMYVQKLVLCRMSNHRDSERNSFKRVRTYNGD